MGIDFRDWVGAAKLWEIEFFYRFSEGGVEVVAFGIIFVGFAEWEEGSRGADNDAATFDRVHRVVADLAFGAADEGA